MAKYDNKYKLFKMKQITKSDVQNNVHYFSIPAIQHEQTKMVDILSEEVGRKPICSFDKMVEIICKYYQCTTKEVMGRNRKKNIVNARHVIMFFGMEILQQQFPNYNDTRIIEMIGSKTKRDRTSVYFGIKKIEWLSKKDIYFTKEFQELKNLL